MPAPNAEEETAIDSQLRLLVILSSKFCPSTTDPLSKNNLLVNNHDVFELALTATRIVRVRRLTEEAEGLKPNNVDFLNPYNILLETYKKGHQKYLSIVLDQLNAILTTIQILKEKKSKTSIKLNSAGLALGKNLLKEMEHSLSSSFSEKRKPESDTTLFLDPKCIHNVADEVIRESRTQFARAVSFYRISDCHSLCAEWAGLLSSILQLIQKTNFITKEQISKQEADKVTAEIMGVRAHELALSGNYAAGVKAARDAWDMHHSVHNLVVLFHCVAVQEIKTKIDLIEVTNASCDALLELDNCLNCLFSASDASASVNEILAVFPILSNSCIEHEIDGGGPLLLGVQSRWVELLVRSDSVNKELKRSKEKKDNTENMQQQLPLSPPGGISVFCILRAHLSNFEHSMRKSVSKKNERWIVQNSDSMFRMLDDVLRLLRKIRDRRNKRNSKQNEGEKIPKKEAGEEDYTLIWQHSATKSLVGDHKDCVWIAEQLWNIGVQLISADLSDRIKNDARWIAAEVFSRAHDFALLTEEEEGESLSRGFLDLDLGQNTDDESILVPDFIRGRQSCACDLSSEFSAHCLLLSVANAVDNISLDIATTEDISELSPSVKSKLKKSLCRLVRAKDEFNLNQTESAHKQHIEGLIAWLALRCLVEIGDDTACADALMNGGLIDRLIAAEPRSYSLDDANQENNIDHGSLGGTSAQLNGDTTSLLEHIVLIAHRSESREMTVSAKHLLFFCSRNLLQSKGSTLTLIDADVFSLGKIQQKILQLSSSMRDVIRVFEDVDKAAKTCVVDSDSSDDIAREKKIYSTEEIDWFTIEAYNRGVNLLFLGSIACAEQLLAIALNLLPMCGEEVECHGAEMRNAYRGAVERKGGAGGNTISSSAGEMISLFSTEQVSSFSDCATSKTMYGL